MIRIGDIGGINECDFSIVGDIREELNTHTSRVIGIG
jgi:hypothetical protein